MGLDRSELNADCQRKVTLRRACVFATAALVLCVLMPMAWAKLAVPALTGRVVDRANLLTATQEASITRKLEAHEKTSGNQIAVLTIPSLQGENLEQYSLRVARQWALGDADFNNGVLLLIAKGDRKLRIEVGYGVEGTLTDAISSYIIRNTITPKFKKGNFASGIASGVDSIVTVLESDAAALERWKERAKPNSYTFETDAGWPVVLFIFVWFIIIFGSVIMSLLTRMFGREIKPGHYRWLGHDAGPNAPKPKRRSRSSSGGYWGSGGGGFGGGGGGFSGGGGGFGGGGSSGSW